MRSISLCALCVSLFVVACAKQPADTPAEQRAEQKAEHAEERADLSEAQKNEQAEKLAETEKARADAKEDRTKFEAELTARIQKADARLGELEPRVGKAKAGVKAKVQEMVKTAKEQRATLQKRQTSLSAVPDDQWKDTKAEITSLGDVLENNLDGIEKELK